MKEVREQIPVFILAGGLGTRISEESTLRPKPMIEIGDLPILLHIMRSYYAHGFKDFVICAGYKSWEIKKFFLTYEYRCNSLEIDHRDSLRTPAQPFGKSSTQESWRVRIIDTGAGSMTGARIAKAYDGLCDVDLSKEFEFHLKHKKLATVLAVKPVARFGELDIDKDALVEGFLEKPQFRQSSINGGYFFFDSSFRNYLSTDPQCVLEKEPLEKLANDKQLMGYHHEGFWHPMDTLRDKTYLQSLWDSGQAPWTQSWSDGVKK